MNHEKKLKPENLYFWILLLIFLSLGFLIQMQSANAMVAAEVEPGIIELSTTTESGFEVTQFSEKFVRKSNKTWVYFCVKELSRKTKEKCFYGQKDEFKDLKKGMRLNGVEYSLRRRIQNDKGYIPLQKNSYFYAALVIRPQI